jgi:hypothetical protein
MTEMIFTAALRRLFNLQDILLVENLRKALFSIHRNDLFCHFEQVVSHDIGCGHQWIENLARAGDEGGAACYQGTSHVPIVRGIVSMGDMEFEDRRVCVRHRKR